MKGTNSKCEDIYYLYYLIEIIDDYAYRNDNLGGISVSETSANNLFLRFTT